MKTARAPENLSPAARRWWTRLQREYADWTPDGLILLESALQAFDRWQQARAEIDRDGITLLDRFGQRRMNPACTVERDSRSAMVSTMRALGLDSEVPAEAKSASDLGRAAAVARWNKGRS
ncbi:MAG: P27 family phage terminase small subunit [Bryobacteraceae bacterium]|nr:P27 family phage terminase small subunit [Bryobacteraceae bacterium]